MPVCRSSRVATMRAKPRTGPAGIRLRHASASFLAGNRVVFDIGGNKCRLVVRVNHAYAVVHVRFVGTRAAYDRTDAEAI
jgi:mRNA interferase HigB